MKHSRTLAVGAFAAAALTAVLAPLAGQASAGRSSTGQASADRVSAGQSFAGRAARSEPARTHVSVDVRVEGIPSTLLPEAVVSTKATSIDKDGKPGDTCEGDTAAVALQDATHGHWTAGPFSNGLGYPVIAIKGESYPFASDYYWSFWVDGKPATTGICGATLHGGERLLFFPQCSQESAASCPRGMFDPAVLLVKRPAKARAGKAVALSVSALANLTGKPSRGAGVKLTGGGHAVTTDASGKAKLTFAKAGSYRIVATAPNSVRDELALKVSR